MAPEVGLEPTTTRLTVACSTIELLRNRRLRDAETTRRGFYGKLFLQPGSMPPPPVALSAPSSSAPESCRIVEKRGSEAGLMPAASACSLP